MHWIPKDKIGLTFRFVGNQSPFLILEKGAFHMKVFLTM